jgi:predicted amidophosphoribosyltransferase
MWTDRVMKGWYPLDTYIYIIDNTVVTGATATGALEAFRKEGWINVKVVAITKK